MCGNPLMAKTDEMPANYLLFWAFSVLPQASYQSHFAGILKTSGWEADLVKMRRLDGVRSELSLIPKPGPAEQLEANRLFDAACRKIQAEWKKRSRSGSKRDLAWLAVTAYEVIGEMVRNELDDVFERRIAEHGRRRRGRTGNPNRFQVGLLAIFADGLDAVNARDRERIGKKLWRAYRHYVPPQFLTGFLMQPRGELLPGHDLSRDFRDWIIDRRADESAAENESRGEYPIEIEEAVEERQSLRLIAKGEDDDWDDE